MYDNEKIVWSKILDVYREHSHLWDKKNINYMNKRMRQESYDVLLNLYKDLDKKAKMNSLKVKLSNMRTSFFRELKKVKAAAETVSSMEDVYRPSLWYFEQLSFIAEANEQEFLRILGINESSRNSCETQYSSNEMVYIEEEWLSDIDEKLDVKPVLKKIKRQTVTKKQEDLNAEQELLNKNDEKWEILAKSIAIQLKDINDEQLTIVNKIISDAIFYGKTGKLTIHSSINL